MPGSGRGAAAGPRVALSYLDEERIAKTRGAMHRKFSRSQRFVWPLHNVSESRMERWNRVTAEQYEDYGEKLGICVDGAEVDNWLHLPECKDVQEEYRKFDQEVISQMSRESYKEWGSLES